MEVFARNADGTVGFFVPFSSIHPLIKLIDAVNIPASVWDSTASLKMSALDRNLVGLSRSSDTANGYLPMNISELCSGGGYEFVDDLNPAISGKIPSFKNNSSYVASYDNLTMVESEDALYAMGDSGPRPAANEMIAETRFAGINDKYTTENSAARDNGYDFASDISIGRSLTDDNATYSLASILAPIANPTYLAKTLTTATDYNSYSFASDVVLVPLPLPAKSKYNVPTASSNSIVPSPNMYASASDVASITNPNYVGIAELSKAIQNANSEATYYSTSSDYSAARVKNGGQQLTNYYSVGEEAASDSNYYATSSTTAPSLYDLLPNQAMEHSNCDSSEANMNLQEVLFNFSSTFDHVFKVY